MASQLPLSFPQPSAPRRWPKASREHDPDSSRQAERTVTDTGRRQSQADRVLEDITAHPGATAGEIAARIGIDRHTVSKRTADLRKLDKITRGHARPCRAKGSTMATWWPTQPPF